MGVSELYTPALMEHSSDPDYKYEMDDPTCTHEGVNPSCGDDIVLELRLDGDTISEVSFTGSGCAISQASTDMMADLVTGMTLEEARAKCDLFRRMARGEETDADMLADELGDASCLRSVARMPARVKCAELGWRTLGEMIEERERAGADGGASA